MNEAECDGATPMHPVVVRMSEDLHEAVKRLAVADDRSVSWIIRRAVRQYVGVDRNDPGSAHRGWTA